MSQANGERSRDEEVVGVSADCMERPRGSYELDCYPHTFSPLLLFAEASYFDKGYSNYNSVAQFFASALSVDMLENVLYDSKNMLYEELLEHVTKREMLVTCCIDAHFTAFQVLPKSALIYYDPLKSGLVYLSGEHFKRFALFMLIKCHYGNSQHIQENEDYYTGSGTNATRRGIHKLWRDVNKLSPAMVLANVRSKQVQLQLDTYLLVNAPANPRLMSTQETGNTCYFQTYLFAVLCKHTQPSLASDGSSLELRDVDQLAAATVALCRRLLEFFVDDAHSAMRPLTNCNVVLDFGRYERARYFAVVTQYLRRRALEVPDYELQHERLLAYFTTERVLHTYGKFSLSGTMQSSPNTKSLQPVQSVEGAVDKLARSHYYKYRAANLMFGFNAGILHRLTSFSAFNALRKNQLLAFYEQLAPVLGGPREKCATTKFRDYYFMAQFEVGQQELVDVHHHTYAIDMVALLGGSSGGAAADRQLASRVRAVNQCLVEQIFFSTQRQTDYDKFMTDREFQTSRKYYDFFLQSFMSIDFLNAFAGLGFPDINPAEKDINSLTQTVFYSSKMMMRQAHRMEYEFEKECINQMARSTLRKYSSTFEGPLDASQKYRISVKIGHGYTYSKYNTLMHFLNVVECYWRNPDLNSIQVFGKDIRALLSVSCQKVFFEEGHTYYHYGPIELEQSFRTHLDLSVSNALGDVLPAVSREKRGNTHNLVITDRVYEHGHLKSLLSDMFSRCKASRFKSDDVVINLNLLSLQLDLGLYEEHSGLLNLPFLKSVNCCDKRQLQVEVSNLLHEFDKKNTQDSVTRLKVEELLFECSYKFMVNKDFSVRSKEFELIRQLNADPAYRGYLLLCKIYVSLCQINKSVEVDYYKIRCDGEYRIVIPSSFSSATSEYLDKITRRHTFSEKEGFVRYGDLPLFDVRAAQPEIELCKVRVDSRTRVQSMVQYVEISNVFKAADREGSYLVFIADNALLVEVSGDGKVSIRVNQNEVEVATIFFNEAVSFLPCFKYADSEDVVLFASRNVHYLVDSGGQFNPDYYGMKHELIECILSEELYVDLNDEHCFKKFKLSDLLGESKTVVYFPDYVLQVQSRQELINLLDLALYLRNVSFFILTLFHLRRASVSLEFVESEGRVAKISGPWLNAIAYALDKAPNARYDAVFQKQFVNLDQHEHLPLAEFVDALCGEFTRYQRFADGQYQIVPTRKQKDFVQKILKAEECFHFSEVGSGKTKVILPLLCQIFLSNNVDAHSLLARGGKRKTALVILVPEHLVPDAKAQVYRYCLNLNFREEYKIYDDIFALLHDDVRLTAVSPPTKRFAHGGPKPARPPLKQIFITSFNKFKKALTYDKIVAKLWPNRERVLVLVDEVDDFLDRDKLVFNICSNKANAFDKRTLDGYFETAKFVYTHRQTLKPTAASPAPSSRRRQQQQQEEERRRRGAMEEEEDEETASSTSSSSAEKAAVAEEELRRAFASSSNPAYWRSLQLKFSAIDREIQDASRSINKSFGIFNEQTLRHCSSNVAHDVEGYRSLIARPYESVNRAMPGSYYSDVERTIYLTYYLLMEDSGKYDELFQQERKFISFEYFSENVHQALDYDDLVYGRDHFSELVLKHPETKDGLARFLYEIILRRMEIRDKSRSVSSVDVVFNFDCLGFTGTPFIDNYPTFAYIRDKREDEIPSLIDRSFYAYASEKLTDHDFERRFQAFQGTNTDVRVHYKPSDFVPTATDELNILDHIFDRERLPSNAVSSSSSSSSSADDDASPPSSLLKEDAALGSPPVPVPPLPPGAAVLASDETCSFNVLVDLCGVFKRSSIREVRDVVLRRFGPEAFHYVYHIDQSDGSDRVLSVNSESDVQFDEEFYKYLCATYGGNLREKIFFFVDNRNVIGKDIPFQLLYQRRFKQPLFTKSVVLAHDVDDFSKIWQAMGRSRTMNDTRFCIYTNGLDHASSSSSSSSSSEDETARDDADTVMACETNGTGPKNAVDTGGCRDVKTLALTRALYVRNCDRKMAGNLSSNYQTLISLVNLSQQRFYHCDEIVNSFLEKMRGTIADKVRRHEQTIASTIFASTVTARILTNVLCAKFRTSATQAVATATLTPDTVQQLLRHLVQHKFEQRAPSGDVHDQLVAFLAGEHGANTEVSYTKQQQKQKQTQQNKNQDSDTMALFDSKNQLHLSDSTENYFRHTLTPSTDFAKIALNLPLSVPVFKLEYSLGETAAKRTVNVYPTVQFLYSHHIHPDYISKEVKQLLQDYTEPTSFYQTFFQVLDQRERDERCAPVEESGLSVGSAVVVHGLQKWAEYNGQTGRVVGCAEGRWGVMLAGGHKATSFKPENLRVVDDDGGDGGDCGSPAPVEQLAMEVLVNHVRQSPQYTLAALREGVYIIGMKDQFNMHDVQAHPARDQIQYIADEMGFVLYEKQRDHIEDPAEDAPTQELGRPTVPACNSVDAFGPYFIEQYILMEMLSKQEVAHNVLDYYVNHKQQLQQGLDNYAETQGRGFVCWRFLMNDAAKARQAKK